MLSTGATPRWQGAETPGYARAASGAVELPFSRRETTAHRLRTGDALLEAELAFRAGGADAFGWSATRWRAVLADLYRPNRATVQSSSTADAAMVDVDRRAIEALMPILDDPPPYTVTRRSPAHSLTAPPIHAHDGPPPSATPMPAPPVAAVTSTEAPFPPAGPLPVFVPPSVTDPVSYPDFLPVDNAFALEAFALEMRAESIEQLVGGDALRHGVSERIETGRSQTNADLVAGRDRVRVQGTLHEHTGHGLAEQAAHLHTTVDTTSASTVPGCMRLCARPLRVTFARDAFAAIITPSEWTRESA